ncbi:hypothetical protein DQ384_34935 [Sphaerisporangium album]|uniref:Uncharacterized protein n=1 Tax=Sphaerisporangium album TaxID=509200 RepID=A0A367EZI3_9ACTN|nr:DUF6461 domain-containing protein [Sphaerisporangium album]RCG22797.1 hypothetical protein DQ384_34935 [Sphaerisporangium album]
MADATAADYAWFEEKYGDSLWASGFCLTFVRDLSPEEAFRRVGVAGRPADDPGKTSDARPIAAYAAIGGAVLLEDEGRAGTLTEVTRRLSAGTVTAAVCHDAEDGPQFLFAADGHLVTGFEPGAPDGRWGASPDRLLPQMRALDLPTDHDDAGEPAEGVADHHADHHAHHYADDMAPDTDEDTAADALLAAMALAERVTGVRLTWRHLARPALVGSAAHLY